jgi:hypothetical protein
MKEIEILGVDTITGNPEEASRSDVSVALASLKLLIPIAPGDRPLHSDCLEHVESMPSLHAAHRYPGSLLLPRLL